MKQILNIDSPEYKNLKDYLETSELVGIFEKHNERQDFNFHTEGPLIAKDLIDNPTSKSFFTHLTKFELSHDEIRKYFELIAKVKYEVKHSQRDKGIIQFNDEFYSDFQNSAYRLLHYVSCYLKVLQPRDKNKNLDEILDNDLVEKLQLIIDTSKMSKNHRRSDFIKSTNQKSTAFLKMYFSRLFSFGFEEQFSGGLFPNRKIALLKGKGYARNDLLTGRGYVPWLQPRTTVVLIKSLFDMDITPQQVNKAERSAYAEHLEYINRDKNQEPKIIKS